MGVFFRGFRGVYRVMLFDDFFIFRCLLFGVVMGFITFLINIRGLWVRVGFG